uniref:beta-mannosidase n=1 Tax=Saccoglossus kowalevskii TaxID=10224 RepID=A0ABM0MJQ5_SACKO|nr:PREDICTED: beta-mannosidase-like [Saccoglossus kowalevskii]
MGTLVIWFYTACLYVSSNFTPIVVIIRHNDLEYKNISYEGYIFSTNFQVDQQMKDQNTVILVCEGIQTVSTVKMNGEEIGKTNNQFIRYVFNVSSQVKEGSNKIEFYFESSVSYANQKSDDYGKVVPPECPSDEFNPECHANFIRSTQSSFGWEMGPAFPTQGIWKSIYLEGYNRAKVMDVMAWPYKEMEGDMLSSWMLNVTVHLKVTDDVDSYDTLIVELEALGVREEVIFLEPLEAGDQKVSVTLRVPTADTWWPVGYGDHPIYKLNVEFISEKYFEKSSKTINVGFRTVELVEEIVGTGTTTEGYSFYFKVNGLPIFVKGASWIPVDSFLDRATPYRIRKLLESALWANMNMIRVWGGGVYENDLLYDFADENGLLIWQDFMFAVSMYPADDEFLATVEDEVRHQVRRLSHHPSIVIWVGNSETELAYNEKWFDIEPDSDEDYDELFTRIEKTILEEDDSRYFMMSSPSNGKKNKEDDTSISTNPNDDKYGTRHFFNYAEDCLDISTYPTPRFVAEFGFQSWPSFQTLERISDEDDWYYDSAFMDHRQHQSKAGDAIDVQLNGYFHKPSQGDTLQQFKDTLYLSQISQSLCYRYQTEHYRRLQSDPNIKTMGALYWHLNSIWQGPTWSSVEFGERFKMLHYSARKFFSPLIVSPYEDVVGDIYIYIVNDHPYDIENLTLSVEFWKWDSTDFTATTEFNHNIDIVHGQSSQIVYSKISGIDNMISATSCSRKECVATFSLTDHVTGHDMAPRTELYLSSFKDVVGLQEADLKVKLLEPTDSEETGFLTEFEVNVTTDAITAFTWLGTDTITGHFSDNGFLLTEPWKIIQFTAWHPVEYEDLKDNINVQSLRDTY